MFCSQCGQQLKDGAKFCAYCGAPAAQPPKAGAAKDTLHSVMSTAKQTVSSLQAKAAQQKSAASVPGQQSAGSYPSYQNAAPMPGQTVVVADQGMAWYKFIIYIQLWASAVVFIGAGITLIAGAHYGGRAALVYGVLPSLHVIDILFGISLLVFAVFCVVTRYDLARFRRQGPTRYLWVYGLSILIPLVYLIAVFAVLNGYSSMINLSSLIPSDSVIELVVYTVFDVIMIIVNKIYFDKRRHLFVN